VSAVGAWRLSPALDQARYSTEMLFAATCRGMVTGWVATWRIEKTALPISSAQITLSITVRFLSSDWTIRSYVDFFIR